MDITLELIQELTQNEKMMWVVGGGSVVSENNGTGIKPPEVRNGYITIEANNWHFHIAEQEVDGIQLVEADSHGGLKSYYVRFSKGWDETLARCYFPNPYLDDDEKRTEFQDDKYQEFITMKDKFVGKDGVVFVERSAQG